VTLRWAFSIALFSAKKIMFGQPVLFHHGVKSIKRNLLVPSEGGNPGMNTTSKILAN
jgi:hypothetical protein